jgi:hypothetical protein
VPPAAGLERRHDARQIVEPDREVDVVVRARDLSRMKADRPAPEEPVLEPGFVERGRELREYVQLALGGPTSPRAFQEQ